MEDIFEQVLTEFVEAAEQYGPLAGEDWARREWRRVRQSVYDRGRRFEKSIYDKNRAAIRRALITYTEVKVCPKCGCEHRVVRHERPGRVQEYCCRACAHAAREKRRRDRLREQKRGREGGGGCSAKNSELEKTGTPLDDYESFDEFIDENGVRATGMALEEFAKLLGICVNTPPENAKKSQ